MSYRRNGLKVLGLSLVAVLGLMAFMAVTAQANWLVLAAGTQLTVNENVAVSAHTEGKLIVEAQKLEILCATVAASGLKLVASSTTAEGKVSFSSCKTWQSGKESPGCKPAEPIVAGGKALLILHNSLTWVLFEPNKNGKGEFEAFTTVIFNPAKCALTEENEVTGELVAECGHLKTTSPFDFLSLDCSVMEATHLLQPAANQKLFGEPSGLKFGENPATLQGIAAVSLSGPNDSGKIWGGDGP